MEEPEPKPILLDEVPLRETDTAQVSIPGILTALAVGLPALLTALTGVGLTPVQAAWLIVGLAVATALGNWGSMLARQGAWRNAVSSVLGLLQKRRKL